MVLVWAMPGEMVAGGKTHLGYSAITIFEKLSEMGKVFRYTDVINSETSQKSQVRSTSRIVM